MFPGERTTARRRGYDDRTMCFLFGEIQLATWIAALHHGARQPSVGAELLLNGDEGPAFLPWQKVWRVPRL